MTTVADSRTTLPDQDTGTVTAPVLACGADTPDTFPFPSKNRSRTTTQRWVRKCGRSVANSETPHQDPSAEPRVETISTVLLWRPPVT